MVATVNTNARNWRCLDNQLFPKGCSGTSYACVSQACAALGVLSSIWCVAFQAWLRESTQAVLAHVSLPPFCIAALPTAALLGDAAWQAGQQPCVLLRGMRLKRRIPHRVAQGLQGRIEHLP